MFVNIPNLDELPETERAREIERILKEIVYKHNREMEEIKDGEQTERDTQTGG